MKFTTIPGKDFEMSVYQTTQNDWIKVMSNNNPSYFNGGELPVEQVSWNDVQVFIEKMNAQNDGYIYRLPTEEEWEFCCRAGSTTDYCFGDDAEQLKEYAWYWDNSDRKTHPVGQLKPNAFGLYDMHGNVWEWTDSLWSPSSSFRVLRGGSWYNVAVYARPAIRIISSPGNANYNIGFRLVRTACNPAPSNTLTISIKADEIKKALWKAYQSKAKREFLKMWKEMEK